jgi:hypothetical protein
MRIPDTSSSVAYTFHVKILKEWSVDLIGAGQGLSIDYPRCSWIHSPPWSPETDCANPLSKPPEYTAGSEQQGLFSFKLEA